MTTPLPQETLDELDRALSQLRHLYSQMIGGMEYPAEAARGLLGPQVARLERLRARLASPAAPPSPEATAREECLYHSDCAAAEAAHRPGFPVAHAQRSRVTPAPSPSPAAEEARHEMLQVTDCSGEPLAVYVQGHVNLIAFWRAFDLVGGFDLEPEMQAEAVRDGAVKHEWWRSVPCACGDHGEHYRAAAPSDAGAFAVTVWHLDGDRWLSERDPEPAPSPPPAPAPAEALREALRALHAAAKYVSNEFWRTNGADGSGGYDAQKAMRLILQRNEDLLSTPPAQETRRE